VAGAWSRTAPRYDESGALHFTLRSRRPAATLPVRYDGLKPANFEEAISIVAIGRWDGAAERVHADKLLVKCPSKYQGVEGGDKQYG
jgi:cytochrome c-type biogenesis protein CcmE